MKLLTQLHRFSLLKATLTLLTLSYISGCCLTQNKAKPVSLASQIALQLTAGKNMEDAQRHVLQDRLLLQYPPFLSGWGSVDIYEDESLLSYTFDTKMVDGKKVHFVSSWRVDDSQFNMDFVAAPKLTRKSKAQVERAK